MKALFSEKMKLQKMASGHEALELSEDVSWEDFPKFVDRLATRLKFEIKEKTDTATDRIWLLERSGVHLQVVFQDFPLSMSLESDSDAGDTAIRKIAADLKVFEGQPIANV